MPRWPVGLTLGLIVLGAGCASVPPAPAPVLIPAPAIPYVLWHMFLLDNAYQYVPEDRTHQPATPTTIVECLRVLHVIAPYKRKVNQFRWYADLGKPGTPSWYGCWVGGFDPRDQEP